MNKIPIWLYFFLMASFLTACSNKKQQGALKFKVDTLHNDSLDTLAYLWKVVDNGDTVGKGYHMHETLSYPEFKNDKALNDTIKSEISALGGWLDPSEPKQSNNEAIEPDSTDDNVQDESQGMEVQVVAQYPGIVVINFSQDQSGGTHPNHMDTYLNWNTKTHKIINLDDVLLDKNDNLTRIGEHIFRKDVGSEYSNYFFVGEQNGVFFLNDNYELAPKGIYFRYNPYEIAPYMAGAPQLLIPYSSIKQLLRPNTVISQFIK